MPLAAPLAPREFISLGCADDISAEQRVESRMELGFRLLAPDLWTKRRDVVGLDLLKGPAITELHDEPSAHVEIVDFRIVGRERVATPPLLESSQNDVIRFR